jgi:hypothetical protein
MSPAPDPAPSHDTGDTSHRNRSRLHFSDFSFSHLSIVHSSFPQFLLFSLLHLLFFVLISLPAIQPLLSGDLTCGYDNTFHLWRAVEIEHLLGQGVFFSRWAPNMAHGYGYPLFNFSASLSAYGPALLHILGVSWGWALNILFSVGWVLSAVAMYGFVTDLFKSLWAGAVAAVLYTYAPFHAYDVFQRGSLSQASAWLLPPLVLWALRRADRGGGFVAVALGTAGLLLTHNAFALLFVPICLAYLWVVAKERDQRVAVRGGAALLLGIGLSTFFWLPALSELRFVNSEQLSGAWVFDFANNFLPLAQLFALPRAADPALLNDWPARGLGLVAFVAALTGLFALKDRARRRSVAFFTFVLGGCLFLVLPISRPVWNAISLLQRVQFPWRLVGPATLCAAVLVGAAVHAVGPRRRRFVAPILLAVLVVAHLGWFYPRHCSPPDDASVAGMIEWERQTDTIGTTASAEFLPVWVEQMPEDTVLEDQIRADGAASRFDAAALPDGGAVVAEEYRINQATVIVDAPDPFHARYLAFYYPGWQVQIDGNPVDIAPSDPEGLITFDVPAGRHTISIRFGETSLRLLADVISLASLFLLIFLALTPSTSNFKPVQTLTPNLQSPVVLAIVLAGLAFSAAVALNVSPYLRGPADWRWVYALPGRPSRQLIPLLVVALYVDLILVWGMRLARSHRLRRRELLSFLGVLALAVPLIQASLLSAESAEILRPIFYRTVSPGASGVFSVGSAINDAADFLRRYPELMPTFPVHPQRYPPGLPLLFYLARIPLERMPAFSDAVGFFLRQYRCHDLALMRLPNSTIATAVIQMALPVVNGLIVFPLYGLARRAGGRRIAIWAAALYPLVPSFALWSSRWDQFYPLLACAIWYLFVVGLTESSRPALLGAGVLFSLASFFSFGLVALLMPMGLYALFWVLARPERRRWGRLAVDSLIFSAGAVSLWLLYRLAFGTGFADIWRVSMSFHLGLERGYWTWLIYHLYDFFAFLGLPLALLFFVALVNALRGVPRRLDPLTLGFALGLLLLDLAGVARGEVARVWLFMTPFAVIVAAKGFARVCQRRWHVVLIALALAVQLLVFNAFLRVVTTGMTDPPLRTRAFAAPAVEYPLGTRLGDEIVLLGYDVAPEVVEPGQSVHLTLYWRANGPMAQTYTAFNHLVAPDGSLAGQDDAMPLHGAAPTTCWAPGEVIADTYVIPVDEAAAPGNYVLETGLYLLETGGRLPVDGPGATSDGRIILATISVSGD